MRPFPSLRLTAMMLLNSHHLGPPGGLRFWTLNLLFSLAPVDASGALVHVYQRNKTRLADKLDAKCALKRLTITQRHSHLQLSSFLSFIFFAPLLSCPLTLQQPLKSNQILRDHASHFNFTNVPAFSQLGRKLIDTRQF